MTEWLKYPPEENKREVWEMFKETGLAPEFLPWIKAFGVSALMIRRRKDEH